MGIEPGNRYIELDPPEDYKEPEKPEKPKSKPKKPVLLM